MPSIHLPTVAELGKFVRDLIERGEDIIGELDFRHRAQAFDTHADRHTDNSTFGEWCIEDTVGTIFLLEAFGGTKDPPKKPTSSPKTQTDRSRSSITSSPFRIAWIMFMLGIVFVFQLVALLFQMIGQCFVDIIDQRFRWIQRPIGEGAVRFGSL